VHLTQVFEIFGNIFTVFGNLGTLTCTANFMEIVPPSGELNPRGVAKYSDFGPIEGYISETAQDTT